MAMNIIIQHGIDLRHGWQRDFTLGAVALMLTSVYMAAVSITGGFPLDDSWIHQVYGRNLGTLGQWAFIPGIPSAASTSPLYTVLLALGYMLRVEPIEIWAHLIGGLALGMAGIFAARLTDRVFPQQRNPYGLIAGLAVISTWQLVWAAASGMETPLFAMLTLAVIWCAWRETAAHQSLLPVLEQRAALRRGAIFGVIGALCALARPEGAILVGLAGISLVLLRPQDLRWQWWVIGAVGGFSLMIAPYLLLNLSLTGGILPNTAAAKWAQHAPLLALPYPTRLVRMIVPLFVGAQVLLFPGVVMYVYWVSRMSQQAAKKPTLLEPQTGNTPKRTRLIGLLPLVWALVLIALYAARLPASYQHGRYVLPALPALVWMGVIGTIWLMQRTRASRIGRIVMLSLTLSAGLLFAAFALHIGRQTYARDVQIINQEMVAAAIWIQANLPTDELLAIHDIGAVGYFAPRPMLDIAGLLSPEVIPLINDSEAMWAYMQQQGAVYLMAFPDQIPGRSPDDPRLCEVFDTNGTAARIAGGENMKVYWLRWDTTTSCPAR